MQPLSPSQFERVRYLLSDDWVVDEDDCEAQTLANLNATLAAVEVPEELHYFALNFNWDTSCDELFLVVRHPLCDHGTALLVYWLAGPGWLYQFASPEVVPDTDRARYDLMVEIEERFLADAFSLKSIRIDPRNICRHDFTADYAAQGGVRRVPPAMLEPSPGRSLPELEFNV
jgi:hypothetical protein